MDVRKSNRLAAPNFYRFTFDRSCKHDRVLWPHRTSFPRVDGPHQLYLSEPWLKTRQCCDGDNLGCNGECTGEMMSDTLIVGIMSVIATVILAPIVVKLLNMLS